MRHAEINLRQYTGSNRFVAYQYIGLVHTDPLKGKRHVHANTNCPKCYGTGINRTNKKGKVGKKLCFCIAFVPTSVPVKYFILPRERVTPISKRRRTRA